MEGLLSESNLQNTEYAVLLDLFETSNLLLISFGGIANRLPIPVFEFMKSLDQFKTNKIFIRDFSQCWYTNGIRGVSNNPQDTIEYLKSLKEKYGRNKCVFIGNSAGGYAALLYGQLLGDVEVHAFSPQTFVDSLHRWIYWDKRWKTEIKNINREHKSVFDLKQVFKNHPGKNVNHHIYWDENHRLDNIHAQRLKGSQVKHYKFSEGGHSVIKQLRDSGQLEGLIGQALGKSS